ncbi:MAG: efflux RND transporter periplasmic adaptor subunit [Candidatus Aminicenantes bacterium]|nr:efflux RND transporter periplasmic adaptor subunit [Candidatus Aminicenantes bacterium]
MNKSAAGWLLLVLLTAACGGRGAADRIAASGTIEAREVNVAPKVGGQVEAILVEEGARVKPGDVLVRVEHIGLDIQLRQAQAGVTLAEAQLALLRRGARDEDIRQGEEALKQAEAPLQVAAEDARRFRELAAKGSTTPKQRDDAEARHTVALAQRDAAREALKKLKSFARPEEITSAEARLAQAQAAADFLRQQIADSVVVSPVAGVVTRRVIEAGEMVTPGATVLTVSELDSVYVMLYITERDLGRLRLGDAAEVRIDAFPDRAFPGRVTYISPQAEFTPKNVQTKEDRVKLVFAVKVEIDNREGALKPGIPADAWIKPAGAQKS